jgi:hypothetical protein
MRSRGYLRHDTRRLFVRARRDAAQPRHQSDDRPHVAHPRTGRRAVTVTFPLLARGALC